jgi:hypothetical protein
MNAPRGLLGLYGTDVSAQLEAMGMPPVDSFGESKAERGASGAEESESRARRRSFQRIHRLKADKRFQQALKVVLNRRLDPWRNLPVEDLLVLLACLSVEPRGGWAKTWQKHWTRGTSKSWKALKGFPDRLQRLADEIAEMNESLCFRPSIWITSSTVWSKVARNQISLLPGTLKSYSAFVERLTTKLPALTARHDPPHHGYSPLVFELSDLVKAVTGRYCDPDVSELLHAAVCVLDPNRKQPSFDALSLAQARARRRKSRLS